MSRTPPANLARLAVVALLSGLCALDATAKTSDRNQPIELESDNQEGSIDGNGTAVWTGNVHLVQGTLDIQATRAEVIRKDGEVVKAIFTGSQVKMHQINDDNTPVDATANRIEYDMQTDIITLIGNYTVKSPRGTNTGEKMVYDTKTGNMQSGGGGGRVKSVIQPKAKAATPPAPQGKR
ncbi:MAG: lipopolysaccharide transport periplasmic protein LptA [Pseudoxanthomonas sp.]